MIHFFTDPHLGQTLTSHTSHDSRSRLRTALYHQALAAASEGQGDPIYCLGDLVHTYRNDETTIQQCMTILDKLTNCIMGNHDVTNRTDSIGTLELLEPLYDVVPAKMNKCNSMVTAGLGAIITMVPHTNDQKLFTAELDKLSGVDKIESARILLLHCNYEIPWETNDNTLNLTEEMAKKLLDKFDYILIGHEHNYREALDGRVILLGNTHPTNFGDISNKYRWTFDGSKMEKHLIWDKEKHFLQITPFSEDEIGSDVQFVKVVGKVDASEYPKYCRWLTKLWQRAGKTVYAIRNAAELIREEITVKIDEDALQKLTETIANEIKGDKELAALFEEIRGEIS